MWSKSAPPEPESKVSPSPLPRPDESVKIGKTILVKGELTGDENLTIEGRVEGRIELRNHQLIVGQGGRVNAEVLAKTVTVIGQVEGNIQATERVEIRESGSLVGDIRAPRVIIADGAKFKGSVDMSQAAPVIPKGIGEKGLPTEREEKPAPPEPKPQVSLGVGRVPVK